MALEEYRRKRDFGRTPEPAPPAKLKKSVDELSYLIQKHDATRLHYDFRLEWQGVLLSWAVTKGPSLNPKDKRLAVRTEDHPLSYGSFEGTIPEGEYGGGTVMLWDRGTWEPEGDVTEGLRKGKLTFVLHGERLKGGWALVRMRGKASEKRENWLLIKESDDEASDRGDALLAGQTVSVASERSMEEIAGGTGLTELLEQYPEVQLATLVEAAPEGEGWVHEVKFDGYRLLVFVADGEVLLRTRNAKDWTARFPAIVAAAKKLKVHDAVLDVEAVVLDSKGRSGFQQLQAALGEGGDTSVITAFAFDLLHLDGESLVRLPLLERKARLQKLLSPKGAIAYSDHVVGSGKAMLENACKMGLEGVVSKQADAPYVAGRQKSWLKSKCTKRQEFVIVGYSDAKSGGRALGAVYLGYREEGELRYAGKAGTGFTMASAKELAAKLKPVKEQVLSREQMKGVGAAEWRQVHWVKPDALAEVEFTEWTEDGRVRHPSFQGLREDKVASDVRRETGAGLTVAGVRITHPERVISETGHITKGELAEYYGRVAPKMLAGIVRRPISLLRCPEGVGKECFYQRSPGRGLGKHVFPFVFDHGGKKHEYLYIEDERGLLEIVQMGAMEIHPWGATIDAIDIPDRMIFDLDPAPDVPFEAVKLAAQDVRQRLRKRGMKANLRCTGGKGLHVWAPLEGREKWPEIKALAGEIANEMVAALPEVYVATMSKAKRTGRIFVDYFRNDYTSTAIADYSVRAKPGAPVAMPVAWTRLESLKSADQFTIHDV
ncbi:ATP-dependent DNA ligase [Bryobacterales bacterium F-183]|nr:ATP-dependent DNA ligase [Bryobacterales bacterium F-183]